MQYELYRQRRESYRNTINEIQRKLMKWGEKNIRDYPWRFTDDIYKIIVAEVMLQRTRADQVKDIYIEFIKNFPDFKSIVSAGKENIEFEIRQLGLFWRADLLYRMALESVEKYGGKLPSNKNELLKLPGVGQYIVSAVLCSGYNIPEPVLDTNTVRVIGRIFMLNVTESSRRNKKFKKIMKYLIDCDDPRKFFYSIIDFAALICKANNPECKVCPLNNLCGFYRGVNK